MSMRICGRFSARVSAFIVPGVLCCSIGCGVQADLNRASSPVSTAAGGAIASSSFGLQLTGNNYGGTYWPSVEAGSLRTFWGIWPRVEAQKNVWTFSVLDSQVATAAAHGVDLDIVLELSPTWASARPTEPPAGGFDLPPGSRAEAADIEDWIDYVATVATRYKGTVHTYELWNEPFSESSFSGSMESLIAENNAAYATLKAIDPTITVIDSSIYYTNINYPQTYFAAGGGTSADALNIHLYFQNDAPEAIIQYVQRFRTLASEYGHGSMPIYVTEMGYVIANEDGTQVSSTSGAPLNQEQAADYVARAYLTELSFGVAKLYWYAWDQQSMGLINYPSRTPKPAAGALSQVSQWLSGATFQGCGNDGPLWQCKIGNGSSTSWIVWSTTGSAQFPLPVTDTTLYVQSLQGITAEIVGQTETEVGPSPVLISTQ